MAVNMKGKSLASLHDLTREEIEQIFKTSELLKLQSLRGQEHPLLKGKTLAMIFENPSTRTRVSFEVGMLQLGGYARSGTGPSCIPQLRAACAVINSPQLRPWRLPSDCCS